MGAFFLRIYFERGFYYSFPSLLSSLPYFLKKHWNEFKIMPRISRGMHFVVDGIYQPPKKLYLCTKIKNYENGRTNDYRAAFAVAHYGLFTNPAAWVPLHLERYALFRQRRVGCRHRKSQVRQDLSQLPPHGGSKRSGALKAQVRMRYHITSDSEYGAMVGEALRQGIVTKRVVSDREVYYLPGPKMLSPQLDFDGLHGAP